MRTLKAGWYCTSNAGPMVLHVQGTIVNSAWDPRMQAVLPVERPEGPHAVKIQFETDSAGRELRVSAPAFQSDDAGKTYVEIVDGLPRHLQYSGTGGIRASTVRFNAEVLIEAWIDIPAELYEAQAQNGVPIPCWLSQDQPTHRVLWRPFKPDARVTSTPVRVEGERAYAHTEWAYRAHPNAPYNWERHNDKWWWRDPTGRLYPTPANANGMLELVPL